MTKTDGNDPKAANGATNGGPSTPEKKTDSTSGKETENGASNTASPMRSMLNKASSRFSARKLGRGNKKGSMEPSDWGLPGELTDAEVNVFIEFQKIVETRGGDFRKTVYCFGEEEGESWALSRWLRARKFDLKEVVKMVETATQVREEAGKHDFYPDPKEALGCDPSLFLAQYPQLYSGKSKIGCPVFISKPGLLNVDTIECITTMDGILNFHWYVMIHDYASRLRKEKEVNENFSRFECFCILDLDKLTATQVSQRALNITKQQTGIDSICFPETMNKMIIVNAPRFFTLTWRLIKGWLDPRTASKIEMLSSRSTWEKRLRELIDPSQLPSDYGGTAEPTDQTLLKQSSFGSGGRRRITELMSVRSHSTFQVELLPKEKMEVIVYTRSNSGATFDITVANKSVLKGGVDVIHRGAGTSDSEPPTHVLVAENVLGPGKFKIRGDSKTTRFSSDNFFIVCNICSA